MESLALFFTVCMLANYLISLSFSFPICNMKIIFSLMIRFVCVCVCVCILEEKMTTHSSILAWRIPWTEEPVGLKSMGLQRVGHK